MKILKNLTKGIDIITEAEIQFELAYRLKRAGFTVKLERTFLLDETFRVHRTNRNCSIRVDILVFRKDKLVCAIEVKDFKENSKVNKENRQFKKYLSLGIPFVYCLCESDINKCVKKVLKIYLKNK